MFKRIIAPLDGTRLAEAALPYAARLSSRLGVDLLLLRIATAKTGHREQFVDELEVVNEASNYLEEVRALLTDPDRPWQLPAEKIETIVRFNADNRQVLANIPFKEGDLVVMTTHARTGLDRLFHESLAMELLRQSNRPVIMLRPDDLRQLPPLEELLETSPLFQAGGENWPRRLIVTLDGTPQAEAALVPATELAEQLRLHTTLLRVTEPWLGPGAVEMGAGYLAVYSESEIAQENKYRREEAYCYLLPRGSGLLNRGLSCSSVVRTGQPVEEILRYLSTGQPKDSLIVMATHARSGSDRLVFGSVTEGVLRQTHLPILMVQAADTGVVTRLLGLNAVNSSESQDLA